MIASKSIEFDFDDHVYFILYQIILYDHREQICYIQFHEIYYMLYSVKNISYL